MIKFGSFGISDIKLGELDVFKAFLGENVVYQKTTPVEYTGFYVQDISGSDNTLSIVMAAEEAPSLTIEKSTNGTTWTTMGTTSTTAITATIPANGKLYLRCQTNAWSNGDSSQKYNHISVSGRYNVGGNIMSLLYGSNYTGNETAFPSSTTYTLKFLFYNDTNLVSAANLSLPATTLASYCYQNMFNGCSSLTTAPATLPATTLAQYCYQSMFRNCSSLTTAPTLPATTLAANCYNTMFTSCTSLTTAPTLPATTLADYCYSNMFATCTSLTTAPTLPATRVYSYSYNAMFSGCTSLTTAPALPATTLASYCYNIMFQNCTSLTTAPSTLPATTLAISCYLSMFYGCTSLTTAPTLPATTLAANCYQSMFRGCSSLTTAPALPVTTLATGCYNGMFRGCSSLTTAPELPATTLPSGCYNGMFFGCSLLNYIKCMATNISATNCTTNWVDGVAASGTFVKNPLMSSWTTGVNGIPSGWTVVNEGYDVPFYVEDISGSNNTVSIKKSNNSAPTLTIEKSTDGITWSSMGSTSTTAITATIPANGKLYLRCKTSQSWGTSSDWNAITASGKHNAGGNIMSLLYGSDFTGEETTIPTNYALSNLFRDNTKIVSSQKLALPATTLSQYCYAAMFRGCTSLTTAPALPATTLTRSCYASMFHGCTSLTTAPALPATTLGNTSYGSMFKTCSSLNSITCMATNISATNCTQNWVDGVAASGTFYKNPSMSSWTRGIAGIPSGWTVNNAS